MSKYLMCLFVLVLVACGGSSTTAPSPATVEQVHQQWINAVRGNQQDVALALVQPNKVDRETFVEQQLRDMAGYMTSSASPTGALQGVDLQAPTDVGAGKRAISAWKFANSTWCYRTVFVSQGGRWFVQSFGRALQCSS